MNASAPLLLIAAGGTGGHMFPAQALAEEMIAKGWRVQLSTDDRGARYVDRFPKEVAIKVVKSATFARGGILQKLMVPFRIAGGIMVSTLRMWRESPSVVIGFGGYPSIPAMFAAWITRKPRLVHEANGVLGRVNQLFAKKVNVVACGTWPTELPEGVKSEHTGNPVRSAILERYESPYIPPGDYPMSILVMGGSQGARILSQVVPPALAMLPAEILKNIRVSHQAREEDMALVIDTYAQAHIPAQVQPFFSDVPDRLSEAQLVITRSGASTVADISIVGRPAIFVPLAMAIRDEQTANARQLVEAGAAIIIPEHQFTPEALAEKVTSVLSNETGATQMATAALSCGVPDATQRLVTLVETLAQADR